MRCARLEDLLGKPGLLAELKSDPGPLGLDTLLVEIGKLTTVRSLGLAEEVFAETSDRIVAAWRARASRMFPSDFAVWHFAPTGSGPALRERLKTC